MPHTVRDWYAVLGVVRSASTEDISLAIEKLARTSAALAVTNPERSQQIRETARSIRRDLLSGPEARRSYDRSLALGHQPERQYGESDQRQAKPAAVAPTGGLSARFVRFLKQGWTCESCGTPGGPGDRFCSSCGAEIKAIPDPRQVSQKSNCASCGARVRPGDRFCSGCGASTDEG
jgi:curved DNA-binding protein CbpA